MISRIIFTLLVIYGSLSLYIILLFHQDNERGIWGYIAILCMLMIECLGLMKIFTKEVNILNRPHLLIVFSWLLYAILVTLLTSSDLFLDLRSILWWPMIYFVFYWISVKSDAQKRIQELIIFFIPLLFIISSLIYFSLRSAALTQLSFLTSDSVDNSIFYIVLLIPLLFLLSMRKKYILLIVAIISTLFSFKRSAILSLFAMIVVCVYIDCFYHKKISFTKSILLSIIIFSIIIGGVIYLDQLVGDVFFERFDTVAEDQGSGRLEIFNNVIEKIEHRPFEDKLMGTGFNSVIQNYSFSAHNDFLEMLYDYGIIGFLLYVLFVIQIIKTVFRSHVLGNNYFQANIASFVIFLIMSMVSHLWLYPTFFAYLIVLWAITNGQIDKYNRK